jgi:hypothetical protein
MTDPPDQPLPSPSEPDAVGEMARSAEDVAPNSLRGRSPILLVGILAIISVIVISAVAVGPRSLLGDDDPSPSSSPSASASPSEPPSPSETPWESPSEPPPGGRYKPPAEADLPPGARLYRGTSGFFLGCITCDGASRFISIYSPGVSVGNAAESDVVWRKDGQFVEFGAYASRPNKGRYSFGLLANGTTYLAGCSMEIGQTSCREQRPHDVAKGDRIVIIASEAGTMVNGQVASTGNFRVDWWFVFVRAA